jgi:hypothetical protein
MLERMAGAARGGTSATGQRMDGAEAWRLEYRIEPRGPAVAGRQRFASTAVTAAVFSDDPMLEPGPRPLATERRPGRRIGDDPGVVVDTVVFRGVGRWNGAPGYTFHARASDGGEPGRGRDGFALTVTAPDGSVVARVDGRLAGGNVQSRRLRLSP